MSAQHSPAPWAVRESRIENTRVEIVDAEGNWVGDARVATAHGRAVEVQEANAHVMAAGPDLLDALRALVDCYGVGWKDPAKFVAALAELMPDARAAIAKAEG